MISTFIVDDETPARDELKRFLQTEADFKLVGEAKDGSEALQGIQTAHPHVVFLDIHMPELNGLEVASKLSEMEHPPFIVFVTAYDQYAIRAFEVNALDYILKPYDRDRFIKTCEKVREALKDRSAVKEQLISLRTYLEEGKPLKITGRKRSSKDKVFIHQGDVLYFHVKLTEVSAHMKNGDELLVNATLKSLMPMLDSNRFQQAHRAYVVNLDQIEKVSPLFGGNYTIFLKGGTAAQIPMSRRYAQKLKKLLKW